MPSAREIAAAQQRREWIATENNRVHEEENRTEYNKYAQQMKAERLTPLPYEEWTRFLPENDDPTIRGGIATDRSIRKELLTVAKEVIVKRSLSDDELAEFGFDIRYRPMHDMELTPAIIADVFSSFRDREPRFDATQHLEPVGHFLKRNRLILSVRHVQIAFEMLWNLHVLQPKPMPVVEPAPVRPEGLNEHGVNLQVDRDPAIEARKRREKYETEIAVTDPETGKAWTQYQLDNLADSETYRRLMRIPRVRKNPALEPKH